MDVKSGQSTMEVSDTGEGRGMGGMAISRKLNQKCNSWDTNLILNGMLSPHSEAQPITHGTGHRKDNYLRSYLLWFNKTQHIY